MKTNIQLPDTEEQQLLGELSIRLIKQDEKARYEALIDNQHYLKSAQLVGEQLRYVVEHRGEWIALLSWNAGSYHLKDREQWIGWDDDQRRQRLPFIANNSRFLILEGKSCPNLATRVMKLCLQRISSDWQDVYGHGLLVVESFVDPQLFRGTLYKAGGWTLLGKTKGYRRARREYYTAHANPKELYIKPLQSNACDLLCAPSMPEEWVPGELELKRRCRTKVEELRCIRDLFEQIKDYRRGRNCSYTVSGLLTLIFCAMLTGVGLGQRDLAEYAEDLSQGQLRALGFRRNSKTRQRPHPSESTFARLLQNIEPEQLQKVLLQCLDHLLGPISTRLIIIDGKALNSSQGLQLVSAFCGETGRFLGCKAVEEKSNEIPAAQDLIQECAQDGAMLLVDALSTQKRMARIAYQDCKVDYFMTVKGNQPDLRKTLKQQFEAHNEPFSPSTRHSADH